MEFPAGSPVVVLLLKAQLGLFEKIVPVAGSVHSDGKVTKPHFAIRHVRAASAVHAQSRQGDLFAVPPQEPKEPAPQKEKRPAAAVGDLFDPPAPVPAAADKSGKTEKASEPEAAPAKSDERE